MKKTRIGIVNYLNTKPLIYNIKTFAEQHNCELFFATPALLNDLFEKRKIDLALLPVAALKKNKTAHLQSKFCIGCDGEVASVGIISNEPIEQLQQIYLDSDSITSNELVKILCREYWNIKVSFSVKPFNVKALPKQHGALLIGDKALSYKPQYAYYNDLGFAWKNLTSLPFVFATWICHTPLAAEFITAFDNMQAKNLQQLDTIILNLKEPYDLKKYYTENISYNFNASKKQAMQLFLSYII